MFPTTFNSLLLLTDLTLCLAIFPVPPNTSTNSLQLNTSLLDYFYLENCKYPNKVLTAVPKGETPTVTSYHGGEDQLWTFHENYLISKKDNLVLDINERVKERPVVMRSLNVSEEFPLHKFEYVDNTIRYFIDATVMDMDGGGRGKYIREKECSRFCVVFFYF